MSSLSKLAKMTAVERAKHFADMAQAVELLAQKSDNLEAARAEYRAAIEASETELSTAIAALEVANERAILAHAETIAANFGLDVSVIRGKSGATVAVRYQHPSDATKTWTGRGREPLWIGEIGGRENAIDLRAATEVDAATIAA